MGGWVSGCGRGKEGLVEGTRLNTCIGEEEGAQLAAIMRVATV